MHGFSLSGLLGWGITDEKSFFAATMIKSSYRKHLNQDTHFYED